MSSSAARLDRDPTGPATDLVVLRRDQRVLGVLLVAMVGTSVVGGALLLVEVVDDDGRRARVIAALAVMLTVAGLAAASSIVVLTHRRRDLGQSIDRADRASEDRLRLAHDQSGIGFTVVDLDGRIREANSAFCRLVGRSGDDVIATRSDEFTHADDRPGQIERRRQLVEDDALDAIDEELRLLHADGHEVWVRTRTSLARDDALAPQYFLAVVVDITAAKYAIDVADRHRAELERSNAELEQFAYVASHDLSEPLRVMSGFADLLRADLGDDLTPDTARYLDFITDAAARMQQLIGDLLAFSRVGRIDAPVSEVPLGPVVEDAVALLRDEVNDPATIFEIGELPVVNAAATHLQHLMLNLLGNAVKFRSPDRDVHVRVAAGPMSGGMATVYVDDNGIGIAERHRERVFRLFQRLHARDEYPGTGMGLAICRKIVLLYGGDLTVENGPLGGSRFVVRLPAAIVQNDGDG